jgi:AraC-like DNA-binding protein
VAAGECWLHSAALGWIPLRAGDVVLLPRGTGHTLADTPGAPTRPLSDFSLDQIGDTTYRLRAGGGGRRALLFCCSVSFEDPTIHPLLELMPPALVVCGAASNDATLPMLLDTMADEVVAQRVGAATLLTRLADVVITRVIRAWVEAQCVEPIGWLAAIRDPHIGRALAAIHQRPGDPWSVESLADVARASRSLFSERFTSVIGMPPARYLARWRMHVASGWLRNERLTVAQVAERLGYESEASFSRAFKRHVGVPPSALRRVEQQGDRLRA